MLWTLTAYSSALRLSRSFLRDDSPVSTGRTKDLLAFEKHMWGEIGARKEDSNSTPCETSS